MTVSWFGDQVLAASKVILNTVSKEVSENVLDDAQKLLKKKAKTTTERGLLSQMSVTKSKFKDGGYVVSCQGPKDITGKYHSSFVELGTYKDEAKPFMRPAAKKNKRKANQLYQEALDKL
jgi:HK97 gp10 family phage protein